MVHKKLKSVVKAVGKAAKQTTALALGVASPVLKPLGLGGLQDKLLGREEGQDLGPLSLDPANAGDLVKPLVMPTIDSEAVESARREALLRRRRAGGRASTILADKRY